MRKIVYLVDQPIDERNYLRFGIDEWRKRGWTVELWDLSPLARPLMWKQFHSTGHKLKEFAGYRPIRARKDLNARFSELGKVGHYIDLAGDDRFTLPVKFRLAERGVVRVVCATGTVPEPEAGAARPLLEKVKKVFRYGPGVASARLADLAARKRFAARIRPGIVVASGTESVERLGGATGAEILEAHNFDYDTYLRVAAADGAQISDYAVFIDQDYPFHAEFAFRGVSSWVTPGEYYPAIRRLLEEVSKRLGLDVLVSAHPRSSYERRGIQFFERFRVEYGSTPELIRDAKLVIGHDSTALQFAVLFGKPVIFVSTDELNATFGGESIALYAAALGKPVINANGNLSSVDWKELLRVDESRYAAYRNKYIKMKGSSEEPLWQIVINRIESGAPSRPR